MTIRYDLLSPAPRSALHLFESEPKGIESEPTGKWLTVNKPRAASHFVAAAVCFYTSERFRPQIVARIQIVD